MNAHRLTCLVLFCRHTRGDRKNDPLPTDLTGQEWICGAHWRAVPALLRRLKRRAARAATGAQAAYDAAARAMSRASKPREPRVIADWYQAAEVRRRAVERHWRLWCRCKRHAIEAAAGIGP